MEAEETQAHGSRFGWLYSGNAFTDCSVRWVTGTPDTVLDRLKILGFREQPVLQLGRSVGVFVYKRSPDTHFAVPVHPTASRRSLVYAVVFRTGAEVEESPIFATTWPDLLRLLAELAPAINVLETKRT